MFRICKSIELESGHLLSKHPGTSRQKKMSNIATKTPKKTA